MLRGVIPGFRLPEARPRTPRSTASRRMGVNIQDRQDARPQDITVESLCERRLQRRLPRRRRAGRLQARRSRRGRRARHHRRAHVPQERRRRQGRRRQARRRRRRRVHRGRRGADGRPPRREGSLHPLPPHARRDARNARRGLRGRGRRRQGHVSRFARRRVLAEHGNVAGLRMVNHVLGEKDASSRRRPEEVEGTEFTLKCDIVIPAVGQKVAVDPRAAGVEVGKRARSPPTRRPARRRSTASSPRATASPGPRASSPPSPPAAGAAVTIDTYLSGKDAFLEYDPKFNAVDKAAPASPHRAPQEGQPRHLSRRARPERAASDLGRHTSATLTEADGRRRGVPLPRLRLRRRLRASAPTSATRSPSPSTATGSSTTSRNATPAACASGAARTRTSKSSRRPRSRLPTPLRRRRPSPAAQRSSRYSRSGLGRRRP